MAVVLNRARVRTEFDNLCQGDEKSDAGCSTSISVSDMLEILNGATDGDGFVESAITTAYEARGWTEDTTLTWADIDDLLDDLTATVRTTNASAATPPKASGAEDTTEANVYSRISERQQGNEFPFVRADEVSDVNKREEALLILTLLEDMDKTKIHQYVQTEFNKATGKDGSTAPALPDPQWIYGRYFSILQRFLLLECHSERRFLHTWNGDKFLPLVSPRSITEDESRVQASETTAQITEEDIPVVDEALWKAWAKIEAPLKALNADTCEPFVRFMVTEYFTILGKTNRSGDRCVDENPMYPYPIADTEPERAQFQRAFEVASEQQKLAAEAFVDQEYKAFRSELDSETVKYLPHKPSDAFASTRYYKKLVEVVASSQAPTTPKRRREGEPVHVTPQKKIRRAPNVTAVDFFDVSEISTSCKVGSQVHFRGHVLSVEDDVRNVETVNSKSRLPEAAMVSNVIVADASGVIRLSLWREQAVDLLPIFIQCNQDNDENTCARVEVKNLTVNNQRQSVAGVRCLNSTGVHIHGSRGRKPNKNKFMLLLYVKFVFVRMRHRTVVYVR